MRIAKVKISLAISGETVASGVSEIGLQALRMAYQPVDFPRPDSDAMEQLICTDREIRTQVIYSRKKLAESISAQLTSFLMDAFEQRDTIMGYPIKEENDD